MAVSSLLFFFFFSILMTTRHLAPVDGQCLADQKQLLLDLKSELVFNSSISHNLVKWNETDDDCCQWGGVECDDSGRVITLELEEEGISGRIGESSSLFRLKYLSKLNLADNDFTATQIPNQFNRLPNLRILNLSYAGFMGPIPSNLHFEGFTNLSYLDLRGNSLNGTIPHHLFLLPSIDTLFLSDNQFSGQINEFPIVNHSKLVSLDLSRNRIQGHIPNFFFQLQNLSRLWLSDNLFNGTFKLQYIQSLPMLKELDLSYNNLSVETTNMNSSSDGFPQLSQLYLSSCNLHDFPNLTKQSSLSELDLSNNRIGGDIPSWIWEIGIMKLNLSLNLLTDLQKPYHIPASLYILDLHSNQLRCELPLLPQVDSPIFFSLANNSLSGVIPTSICINASQFAVLDLSFNNLSGSIPPCLLEENIGLQVLSLRGNNINGVIPDQFSRECALRTFDVNDNNLGGKIPKSLANCRELVVMNVGKNNFDDSFPCMLPMSLRILVLRSNRFHGDLTCHQSWPNLQILDISSNNFSGTLYPLHLSSWRVMMPQSPAHLIHITITSGTGSTAGWSTKGNPGASSTTGWSTKGNPDASSTTVWSTKGNPGVDSHRYYRDEVTLTVKGHEVKLEKIWPYFTSIDLSCNNFHGDIPHAFGNLTSLYLLNLSHNALTRAIPKSLGALTELGSLDISANQLRGRIPEELAQLTFLSVLNVSYNHLTGMIPNGRQFQTFSADSFEGNTGLCGFPLNTSCSDSTHGSGVTPSKSKHEDIEWEYVFAALGYVVGLGSILWTLLCSRSFRERYFEKIEEVVDKIFYERGRRRRHERRRRRRLERRNEVIRRRDQ